MNCMPPVREPWSALGPYVQMTLANSAQAPPTKLSRGPTKTKSGHRQTVMVPEGEISLLMVGRGNVSNDQAQQVIRRWNRVLLSLLTWTPKGIRQQ